MGPWTDLRDALEAADTLMGTDLIEPLTVRSVFVVTPVRIISSNHFVPSLLARTIWLKFCSCEASVYSGMRK